MPKLRLLYLQAVTRFILQGLNNKLSYSQLADSLNSHYLPTPHGADWSVCAIKNTLKRARNPKYSSLIRAALVSLMASGAITIAYATPLLNNHKGTR
jgi:hypothetical protein